MAPKLELQVGQKLILTPGLQHALKVLQLPTLELNSLVNQELAENPFLEEGPDGDGPGLEPATERSTAEAPEGEQTQEVDLDENPQSASALQQDRWDDYFWNNDYEIPKYDREINPDYTEPQVAKQPTLAEHLLWQLRLVCNTDQEYRLGELVIGNLDERGFLALPLEDIAAEAQMDLETAAYVLELVQNLEPVGVGARDVKESLLIQLRHLPERHPLAEAIVEKHFLALERHQLDAIVRAEKAARQDVVAAAKVIAGLDPYPGRHYTAADVEYVVPDVILEKHDDQYVIIINDDQIPELRVSRAYRQLLRRGSGVSPETRQYLHERLDRAQWLIRSIEERRKTLYRVVEAIVEQQRDFFEKGVEHLRPLNLRQIADRLGLHESTISRVTSQKYIQTPRGLFRLKYFFSSQIKTADGGDISSTSVKAALQELVGQENSRRPLSDQRLTEMLNARGFQIARRTVAKYREELNLLPASQRRGLE